MSLDNKMDEARKLWRSGEIDIALNVITKIISEYPNNPRPWALKASIFDGEKKYKEAIIDIDKAIFLSPQQPVYNYQKGVFNFNAEKYPEAVQDLNLALNKYKNDDITFTQEVYFFRAETYIKLGKKAEALSDIAHIPDNFQTWTFALRSKADLIKDCNDL